MLHQTKNLKTDKTYKRKGDPEFKPAQSIQTLSPISSQDISTRQICF